jgi:hypothetical protein
MTTPDSPGCDEPVAVARDFDEALDAAGGFANGLVGLPAEAARARVEAEGLLSRVVDLDDSAGSWITADLRLDRVTLFLRDSRVERATAG